MQSPMLVVNGNVNEVSTNKYANNFEQAVLLVNECSGIH